MPSSGDGEMTASAGLSRSPAIRALLTDGRLALAAWQFAAGLITRGELDAHVARALEAQRR